MKISNSIKVGVAAFLLGGFLTAGAQAASAVDGQVSSYSTFGYSYQNYSSMQNTSANAVASTTVRNANSENMPGGYMGVNARIFTSGGTEKGESGFKYTNGPSSAFSVPYLYGPSGTYYSYGVTRAYNGNGYNSYYTFKSPNLNH